jgi:hypothetical protein
MAGVVGINKTGVSMTVNSVSCVVHLPLALAMKNMIHVISLMLAAFSGPRRFMAGAYLSVILWLMKQVLREAPRAFRKLIELERP